jgi:hypothetical protein
MSLARRTDIDTSHAAAASVVDSLNRLQADVLDVFRMNGSMTDKTLNACFDGFDYAESTVRKRRSELTALGLIKDTGERDGRHAVWALA